MSTKKLYLYSNINTCPPCRMLVSELDKNLPGWKNQIEYRDVNRIDQSWLQHLSDLNVMKLPSFTDDEKIIFTGFSPDKVKTIVDLCTSE